MSEPEGFIARWSRLKRESEEAKANWPAEAAPTAEEGPADPDPNAASEGSAEPALDPADLPPIESITAGTDIRAFLQAGVPAALKRAALRRAWTADPAIRDFIGLAENQWDFTDPTAIPGFGPLPTGEPLGRLVAQALGQGGTPAPAPPPPAGTAADLPVSGIAPATPQASPQVHGMPERNETDKDHSTAVEGQQQSALVAMQHPDPAADKPRLPSRRPHGGALPK